jgi:hypothetical protein
LDEDSDERIMVLASTFPNFPDTKIMKAFKVCYAGCNFGL